MGVLTGVLSTAVSQGVPLHSPSLLSVGHKTHLLPDQDLILVLVTLRDLVLERIGLAGAYLLAHIHQIWS